MLLSLMEHHNAHAYLMNRDLSSRYINYFVNMQPISILNIIVSTIASRWATRESFIRPLGEVFEFGV
jgi:hypothetical protein